MKRIPSPTAEALLAGAGALIEQARLQDVLKFVTASRLQQRTGLSSGAIYSSFPSPVETGRAALIRSLHDSSGASERLTALVDGLETQLAQGDPTALDAVAEAGADQVLSLSNGSRKMSFDARLLASAVATEDRQTSEELLRASQDRAARAGRFLEIFLEVSRRELVELPTVEDLNTLLQSLTDGLAIRMRIDPAVGRQEAATVLRAVLAALTRDLDLDDEGTSTTAISIPPGSTLSEEKRRDIAHAVVELYQQSGWSAVTLSNVAVGAGVSRNTIRAHFGNRDGLAAIIWAGFAPVFRRISERDRSAPAYTRIRRFLVAIADRARDHPAVTRSLVASVILFTMRSSTQMGAPEPSVPDDPRSAITLVDLMAGIIEECAGEFREALVRTPRDCWELGAYLVISTLIRAITRPVDTADELVSFVCETSLRGALAFAG